eukprot:TRINITY_DN3474_c0_g1_i2.p1 TRINITY_DN3474_c0_g1~~TRINITY_DN3474_c0_g1_i2.p1  ORF type:complete len:239 (+),score=58.07 TRINITY_DN3474_c0_g1_i2:73-789(+)
MGADRLLAAAGALAPRAAGKGSGGLPLFIRTSADELEPYEVPVDATVRDLAAQYAAAHSVPAASVRLLYQGSELRPSAALADTGVSAEAVVEAVTGRLCWQASRDTVLREMAGAGYRLCRTDGEIARRSGVHRMTVRMVAGGGIHRIGAVSKAYSAEDERRDTHKQFNVRELCYARGGQICVGETVRVEVDSDSGHISYMSARCRKTEKVDDAHWPLVFALCAYCNVSTVEAKIVPSE